MNKTEGSRNKSRDRTRQLGNGGGVPLPSARYILLAAICFLPPTLGLAQQPPPPSEAKQPEVTVGSEAESAQQEPPLPGDWAPQLLDAILSSPNPEAHEALYHAAFAAGPAIVPQLAAALKDDRTAEFAAQSLAFIGGEKALESLWKLLTDPRDLNLRRFYYGTLGEFDSPQATDILFDVINKSDSEPDRTVSEAAVLALTVRSDPKLIPRIREAANKVHDVVIHDDLDNALEVIEGRAKSLALPEGKKLGGSVEAAVRTYFLPALELPPPEASPPPSSPKAPAKSPSPSRATTKPPVSIEIPKLTLSPDKTRALARVIFEDPAAVAQYDMVLQRRYGNWTIASIWLGSEIEKPEPNLATTPSKQN